MVERIAQESPKFAIFREVGRPTREDGINEQTHRK